MHMRLTTRMLKKLIKEEYESLSGKDPKRFLHGEDPEDSEGAMVKSRLYSMKRMADEVHALLQPEDQLPGWVQDHVAVAHENLRQIHGYLTGSDVEDDD